tara:strand:+ start:494 stop:628 length:135 start_codon:yes stop_codon:yes gene_type:complete
MYKRNIRQTEALNAKTNQARRLPDTRVSPIPKISEIIFFVPAKT